MTIGAAVVRLHVEDLEAAVPFYETMYRFPFRTPNGRRAILRHPQGGVFEYVGR